jgi:hypothetical protein
MIRKTDISIHKICIATIKRKTIEPYIFKWTNFHESLNEFNKDFLDFIEFESEELPICSTIIDKDNWSILTTRRIATKVNGNLKIGNLNNAISKSCGNFKGNGNVEITFGDIQLENKTEIKYFIETGRASMVMIYGVQTRINMK